MSSFGEGFVPMTCSWTGNPRTWRVTERHLLMEITASMKKGIR